MADLTPRSWPNRSTLSQRRFPNLQETMTPTLASADKQLAAAAKSALDLNRVAAATSLADAAKQIATLRKQVTKQSGDDAKSAFGN